MNVSNVVKPVCYGIHWVPTQFKYQDNSNDNNFFVINLLLINQDHKSIHRTLAIDFVRIFLVTHVSNNFPESVYQSRYCFGQFWFIMHRAMSYSNKCNFTYSFLIRITFIPFSYIAVVQHLDSTLNT